MTPPGAAVGGMQLANWGIFPEDNFCSYFILRVSPRDMRGGHKREDL